MKDITGGQVTTSGNLVTDGIECSIDSSGMGHIMSVLSNMYTDKEGAVLREYSANAWDSHVEAGNTDPIEVTLPSTLQPTLLIQDYGIGLSKHGVTNVFGSYGTSTKRDSNAYVGALGIGSKSAFTLGQQFIVTAVKDGLKNVVLFALNESNVGTMKVVVEDKPTDERNGVLISLAVEDVDTMVEAAQRFFAKWVPGRVLVDGKQPESIWEDALKPNESVSIVPDQDGSVFVTMGQISYAVSADILRKVQKGLEEKTTVHRVVEALIYWSEDSAIFFHGEIGDFDIAPSREAIRDTPRTVNALRGLVQGLADTISTKVQEQVSEQPNAFAAIRKFEEVRSEVAPLKVLRKDVNWNGVPMRETVKIVLPNLRLVQPSWKSQVKKVYRDTDIEIQSKDVDKVVVVRVKDDSEASAVQRFAKRFLEDSDYDNLVLAIGIDAASFGWFTFGGDTGGATVWSIEEYRAEVKALRVAAQGDRVRTVNEPSYSLGWGRASREIEDRTPLSEILDEGLDVIIYQDVANADQITRDALKAYNVIVLLGQQSRNALVKRIEEDGQVQILEQEEARKIVQAYADSLFHVTDVEKEAIGAEDWMNEHHGSYHLRSLTDVENVYTMLGGEDAVTSRVLTDAVDTIALARMYATQVSEERRREIRALAARSNKSREEWATEYDVEPVEYSDVLPILGQISTWNLKRDDRLREHVLAYVNSH